MINCEVTKFDSLILGADFELFDKKGKKIENEDGVIRNCENKLEFDSEYLMASSYIEKGHGKSVATVMFPISSKFIKELKLFIEAMEIHYGDEIDETE